MRWYWPQEENLLASPVRPLQAVRLFAPFDPVVWDRHRFELFWGWAYRFEAYTPAARALAVSNPTHGVRQFDEQIRQPTGNWNSQNPGPNHALHDAPFDGIGAFCGADAHNGR